MATSTDLLGEYQKASKEAKTANEARYKQGLGLMQDVVGLYKPGGSFGASGLSQIEATKTKDVATMGQSQVSSGLFGTSVPANNPMSWEANVGNQARLNLQDLQTSRYADALSNLTNFISSISQTGPDAGLFSSLIQAASAGGGTTGGGLSESARAGLDVFGRPLSGGSSSSSGGLGSSGYSGGGYSTPTTAGYSSPSGGGSTTPAAQQAPTTAAAEPTRVPGKVVATDAQGDWGYNENGEMVLLKPAGQGGTTNKPSFMDWQKMESAKGRVFKGPDWMWSSEYSRFLQGLK